MKPVFVSKYEATKCMKQHIISIHNSEASKETSRWRTAPSYDNSAKSSKQQQYHKMDEVINSKNKMLSERLYKVVTEDRVHRTKEAGPGWRSGIGGTVIDCYPTENKQVLYYKKFRNENRQRALQWKQHQLNEANVEFYSYLAATKPSYGVDQLAKEYRKNRVSYDLYANRPNTALTLGIYDVAAKEIAREKLKREGYRANLNYSSSELNHKIEEMWQQKKTNNTGTSKVINRLKDVKSVADFIDMNVASIEEKWNPAVNDNVRNSTSNLIMVENRLKPGYVGKREFHSNYLSDMPSASQTIKNSSAFAVDGRRGSGGMRVDYDQIRFSDSDVQLMGGSNGHLVGSSSGAALNESRRLNHDGGGVAVSYDSYEFNLYNPRGSHSTPPPLSSSQNKSRSNKTGVPMVQARPTSGGTMQYADSRGMRDLTQYQHSIEEVSEFNFQNLKAEYIEHYYDQVEAENEELRRAEDNNGRPQHRKNESGSPSKRPVSAGAKLMKVHHTRATAAAAAASLLPPERPVTPTYALPKTKTSPTNKGKAGVDSAVGEVTAGGNVQSTTRSRSNSPTGGEKGGAKTRGITYHDDPLECLPQVRWDQQQGQNFVEGSSPGRHRPRSSGERYFSSQQQQQQLQRPHSTGGGGRYRDYSGSGQISKKNVSFDNKLDSTIILDYSQSSDSVAAAAIAAANGGVGVGTVGNSSSSSLEESNIMFLNQY